MSGTIRGVVIRNKFGFFKGIPYTVNGCIRIKIDYQIAMENTPEEEVNQAFSRATSWGVEWTGEPSFKPKDASPPMYLKLGNQYLRFISTNAESCYGYITLVNTRESATKLMFWAGDMIAINAIHDKELRLSDLKPNSTVFLQHPNGNNDDKHLSFYHPLESSVY
jgi:hypothetical protein